MEPTSSAASAWATMSAVAITSILPGVNGDALIGAFAGAVVFALHAKDLPIIKRLIYMMLSILLGYMGAGEVMHWTGIQSHTIAALVASALIVTALLSGIDKIRQFDITSLWKKG
jgi:hypothetical protein